MRLLHTIFAFVLLVFAAATVARAAELGTDAQRAAGKELYEKHCNQCHGDTGDGLGPAAAVYWPRPRDFTGGKYKIRVTANGELPTDKDLKDAIVKGLAFKSTGAYTVMPPWPRLKDEEVMNLVYYIKSFSADFADPEYNNPKVMDLPKAPPFSAESAKRGRTVFEANECIKCHGVMGRGDGRSAPTLKDDWGNHLRAADLTKKWTFRGGGTREDIFRTVTTGFNGTPMPAYADSTTPEQRWDLVNYIYSLSDRDEPNYNRADRPILVSAVKGAIDISDADKAREQFASATPSYIAIVGQVVEPGRSFVPGVNELEVRAIYNNDDVAVMLEWHDIRADTQGKNGPELKAPPFNQDEELAALKKLMGGGEEESDDDDPFGEDEEEEDPFAEEEEDPFAEDDEEDTGGDEGLAASEFSDAVAIQIPTRVEDPFKKPYFLFGDSTNPVDLWYVNLADNQGKVYTGKGAGSVTPSADKTVEVVTKFDEGRWSVIFKRKRVAENSLGFEPERFFPVAFSVWDGFAEERGDKRGITSWYQFYFEPMEEKSAVGPMLAYGGGLLLFEILLIGFVRRRVGQ